MLLAQQSVQLLQLAILLRELAVKITHTLVGLNFSRQEDDRHMHF